MTDERTIALQAVLDRVGSYQEGATAGTVEKELRGALDEAGLELSDTQVATVVDAIEDGGSAPEASAVLA
ncbi:hypothetical protein BH11ACT8_BH11ACT8_09640 [soil metagenome]